MAYVLRPVTGDTCCPTCAAVVDACTCDTGCSLACEQQSGIGNQTCYKVGCGSADQSGTLCGFSEYVASDPPKKYRKKSLSGSVSYLMHFDTGTCEEDKATSCTVTHIFSGVLEYAKGTCERTADTGMYRINRTEGCAGTWGETQEFTTESISGGLIVGEGPTSQNDHERWFSVMGGCHFMGLVGASVQTSAMTGGGEVIEHLSQEDTPKDAFQRAGAPSLIVWSEYDWTCEGLSARPGISQEGFGVTATGYPFTRALVTDREGMETEIEVTYLQGPTEEGPWFGFTTEQLTLTPESDAEEVVFAVPTNTEDAYPYVRVLGACLVGQDEKTVVAEAVAEGEWIPSGSTCSSTTGFITEREGDGTSFGWRAVRVRATLVDLIPNQGYIVRIGFGRRPLGSVEPWEEIAEEVISFVAEATTEITDWIEVPLEVGFETRAQSCSLEPTT